MRFMRSSAPSIAPASFSAAFSPASSSRTAGATSAGEERSFVFAGAYLSSRAIAWVSEACRVLSVMSFESSRCRTSANSLAATSSSISENSTQPCCTSSRRRASFFERTAIR